MVEAARSRVTQSRIASPSPAGIATGCTSWVAPSNREIVVPVASRRAITACTLSGLVRSTAQGQVGSDGTGAKSDLAAMELDSRHVSRRSDAKLLPTRSCARPHSVPNGQRESKAHVYGLQRGPSAMGPRRSITQRSAPVNASEGGSVREDGRAAPAGTSSRWPDIRAERRVFAIPRRQVLTSSTGVKTMSTER
jgi:hypothetical protein